MDGEGHIFVKLLWQVIGHGSTPEPKAAPIVNFTSVFSNVLGPLAASKVVGFAVALQDSEKDMVVDPL